MGKPVFFVGTSRKALRLMPEEVRRVFGSALWDAQSGEWPSGARPFGEGTARGILKLVERDASGTYRLAFTLEFPGRVYVLHAFQKKATHGIATPGREIATVVGRYRSATAHFREEHVDGEVER